MLNLVTAGTPSCFAFFVRLRGFVIQTLSASRRIGGPVKKHLQHAVFLVIVACLMICAYGRIEYDQYPYSGWDLAAYRAMAAAAPQLNPIVSSPFAYRLFGPYLVGLLPYPDPTAFYAATVIASVLLIILLYYFLCEMGLDATVATVTTLLFTFNKHLFGFTVWDYFQINDVLTLIFVTGMLWAMIHDRWMLFGLILLLGAVTREINLVMLPVDLVYQVEKGWTPSKIKLIMAASAPALVVFALLRLLIDAPGYSLTQALLAYAPKLLSVETWFRLLVNPFIPLTLLPLIYLPRTIAFFRNKKYLLVFLTLVLLSTLFGINNERLLAPAFVVFYWLIGVILEQEIAQDKRIVGLLIVVCALIASIHHEYSRFDFVTRELSLMLSIGSFVLLSAVAIGSLVTTRKRAGKLSE